MKSSYSDIGIVVRSVDSGEADKYISVLSENHGLTNFVARGARRLASKKSPHLDLLNLIRFQASRGESPKYIDQVESVIYYPKIKSDYAKTGMCFTIIEILTSTLPADVEDKEIYLSLKAFLDAIENATSQQELNRLGRKFGLFTLRHLGYPAPKIPESVNLTSYFETIISKKLISPKLR